MAKGKKCEIILNTKNGYCMTPHQCNSITEAIKYAKEMGLAFRIFADGKLIRKGWYAN